MSDLNAENRLVVDWMMFEVPRLMELTVALAEPGTVVVTSMAVKASAKCEWWGLEWKT